MLLFVLPAAFLVAGLAIGRWWVIAAALATWAGLAVYLYLNDVYLNDGWFGAGWGDFGIAFNVIAATATVLGAALGVGVRYAWRGVALGDLDVEADEDERPEDDREDRRQDALGPVEVLQVVLRVGDHNSDHEVDDEEQGHAAHAVLLPGCRHQPNRSTDVGSYTCRAIGVELER